MSAWREPNGGIYTDCIHDPSQFNRKTRTDEVRPSEYFRVLDFRTSHLAATSYRELGGALCTVSSLLQGISASF
ncbi:hypothetical protein E4U55_001256 [Claviceps digitariae]|nr:hypothetical protein E4U55_001256 [Claviceps digitariae]